MSDKKIHKPHYEESDEFRATRYKIRKLNEVNAINFDAEDDEELYIELQRFLK